MQENQLFDETIYENVKIGKLNAKKSEILNACKLAHVSEFTDKFPEKLLQKLDQEDLIYLVDNGRELILREHY